MDRESIVPGQTIVVEGDRIVSVGVSSSVTIPPGAQVLDGQGRFLLPGLTDGHVHLESWFAPTRADFGDAPLYLAWGVTSVFNMWGSAAALEWKHRVEAGQILGPTIYTASEPVMGPRLRTPEDVEAEIVAQRRGGYDFVKFYEGLSRPAYQRMNTVARREGIPLVGHAPSNLTFEDLIEGRQHLAHTGSLANVYFLPMASHGPTLLASGLSSLLLLTIVLLLALSWLRRVGQRTPERRDGWQGVVALTALAGVGALLVAALVLPGGPLVESGMARFIATGLSAVALFLAGALIQHALRRWKDRTGRWSRFAPALAAAAAFALAGTLIFFWIPVMWRSTESGVNRVAAQIHDAQINVVSTLVLYDTAGGPGRRAIVREPAIDFLRPSVRDEWRRASETGFPGYSHDRLMRRVAALHRQGVTLVAGTDAMGVPLMVPGPSLHRELALLVRAGLTPYEAIAAATTSAAALVGQEREYGRVAPGLRADLLLVEKNPLEDLSTLEHPAGVMTRGRWLPRARLQQMIESLKDRD